MLTRTHIVRLRPRCRPDPPLALIQAFTLPTCLGSIRGGIGVLQLSHEGILQDDVMNSYTVRNSIMDHVTEPAAIRLLYHSLEGNVLFLSCIDLVLPEQQHPHTTLLMTIDSYDIAQIDYIRHRYHSVHTLHSDDGYARGFVWFSAPNDNLDYWRPQDAAVKFTIDASSD